MTDFLTVALRNAARGYRVHPLRGKNAILKDWPNVATTDETQIRAWAEKFPDYNVGVAAGHPDPNATFVVAIVDSDRVSRLKELSGEHAAEWFDTYSATSGRPDRAHFYYLMTDELSAFGNKKWAEPGIEGNVFELKVLGGQVVAEGSTHPITGNVYKNTDRPLITFPAGLLALMRECRGKDDGSRERVPREKMGEGGRHDALVREAGRVLRVTEMSKHVLTAHLQDFNELWLEPPLDSEEVERVAMSCKWKPEPEVGEITVGQQPKPPEAAALPQHNRPTYPIAVWDGTAAGEFAKICTHDNNIPRKFFVEAWNCILGAVVGDRLTAPVDGGIPRSYTFLITKAGKGKGTVIRRAVGFWKATWANSFTSVMPGLLRGEPDFFWKPKGIGARNASASSGPGMTRLTQDDKKTPEQFTWQGTIPRIISVHEETKTFLSALFIEGGTGTNLDGVVCQLWDDVSFAAPGTGTRQAIYGEMQFSLLCAITEDDWFDLLSKGDVVGGGLMSRLSIVGSLGEYANVATMNPRLDFTSVQKQILHRIERLAEAPCILAPTEGARRVMAEWHLSLPEEAVRANIRAWRSALLLSFLRQEDTISEKTAIDATLLGDYQLASHLYYTVLKADNPLANVQYKILRVLEMKGPVKKGRLQDYTNANRVGTELWNRALEGLIRDGRVGKREEPSTNHPQSHVYYLAARD